MINKTQVFFHEGVLSDYEHARICLFGIPYDGTVSNRPGTRFGPAAIRQELDGLETYSPYLDLDMTDFSFCDLGDLVITIGNKEAVMAEIEAATDEILSDGKQVLMIGGEHLVTYPVIKSHLKKYPDLHILHLDAHADLRTDYMGEALSHATVMRLTHNQVGDGKIWQFGIRSGTKEEFEFAKTATHFHPFSLDKIEDAVAALKEVPVYVTIDLDVLDPSIMAGTGTQEPGGVTFNALMDALMAIKNLSIVGGDVVELSPHYDNSGVSTAVGCKVVRELGLIIANGGRIWEER